MPIKRKITGIIDDGFPDIAKGTEVIAEWEEEYGWEEKNYDTPEGKVTKKRLIVTEVKNQKINGTPYEGWFAVKVNDEWRIVLYFTSLRRGISPATVP